MSEYLSTNLLSVWMTSVMQSGDHIDEPEDVKQIRERYENETNIKVRSKIVDEWISAVQRYQPIEAYDISLYRGIQLLSKRFLLNHSLSTDDIAAETYIRIKKYNTFKPYKENGQRVSAFAYVTQVVKNVEFAMIKQLNKDVNLPADIAIDTNIFNFDEGIW